MLSCYHCAAGATFHVGQKVLRKSTGYGEYFAAGSVYVFTSNNAVALRNDVWVSVLVAWINMGQTECLV